MDQLQFLTLLTQWGLGMISVAVVGILSMYVKIISISQRLLDHIERCEELHSRHERAFESLWEAHELNREKIANK